MVGSVIRQVCWLSVLASCNLVYNLDETAVRDLDSDRDGIPDADDNCPRLANPDQADRDGDGVGDSCGLLCFSGTRIGTDNDRDRIDDGCDSCALGRPADEDGDGVEDACDNCPGWPNADQANVDLDDRGDACDPSTRNEVRTSFSALDTLPGTWVQRSVWTLGQGTATTRDGGLTLPAPPFPDSQPAIEVGLVLPSVPNEGDELRVATKQGGCRILYGSGGWHLAFDLGPASTPIAYKAASVLRLRVVPYVWTGGGPMLNVGVTCTTETVSLVSTTGEDREGVSAQIDIAVADSASVTYVDVTE